jgi:outer membrane protein OmpA-like peptidoglycan-associated protein
MSDEQREHASASGAGASSHGGGGGHGGGGHGGGGGGHEEAHEGAPEWLISFADNVMLQMGFFVILLGIAMSTPKSGSGGSTSGEAAGGPTAEQLDWAIALREAFNNPVDLQSTDPRDFLLVRRLQARRGLAEADSPGQKGADHDVQSIRPSDYFGWGGTVPFESESSQLNETGQAALDEMVQHLRGYGSILEIRGHASAAEAFSRPDRGAALSYDRARVIADALAAAGIDWKQMRVIACGDSERIVPRAADPQQHAKNQRVEVIATQQAPDCSD